MCKPKCTGLGNMQYDFLPRSQILETLAGGGTTLKRYNYYLFFNRLRRAIGLLRKYQLEYFYALMHVIFFKIYNFSKFA